MSITCQEVKRVAGLKLGEVPIPGTLPIDHFTDWLQPLFHFLKQE
jgi:hypothetical protein